MSQLLRIILIVLVLGAAVFVWVEVKSPVEVAPGFLAEPDPAQIVQPGSLGESEETNETTQTTYQSEKGVELIVTSPTKNSVIMSPLTVTGSAPGFWYFEATFPIVVVNWDGLIIGEGYAQAQSEWMTSEMVPFIGTVEFDNGPSVVEGRQAVVGALILQRDNPSGLPENDDAIEFSIRFSE